MQSVSSGPLHRILTESPRLRLPIRGADGPAIESTGQNSRVPDCWVLKFKWCEARYVANRIRRIAASVVERSEFGSDVAGR
jgi:hypothetical protein